MSWARVNLGDIAEFKNGLNFNKDQYGQGVKYISVADFQDYFSVKTEGLAELKEDFINSSYFLKEGDILFVRSNGNKELVGRNLFVENTLEPLTFSGFCIRARFTKEDVIPKFYAYLFKSKFFRNTLSANAGGTNINNLNQGILSNLNVPKPPLSTQRKIASILSAYDELIENNLKRIKLLEKKALMQYKILFNTNKIDERLIEDVWEIKYGKNLSQTKITQIGKYPVYGAAGRIGFYEEFNYEFPVALVTSRGNGSGVAHRTNQSAFVTNNSFAFVPKRDFVNVHFHLAEMILRDLELTQLRSGTAQPQLTIAGLIGVKLKLPQTELLFEFNKIVDPVFELIFTLENQNTKLRDARDILLPRLMNGQIEV